MSATPRRVAVLSGKRGGYGAMKPMLRAIENDPTLALLLILTDQHLNPQFGATIREVEADFTVAAAVDMAQASGKPRDRVMALGTCLTGMVEALTDLAPDLLVLYGDRGEVLVTAIAALNLGIPIAHLQGGDISGNVDELMRHAITKLSHLHFASCEDSAARIRGLGEESWRVHVVGDNHVDPIVAGEYSNAVAIGERFGLEEGERPIVILQHPETTRSRDGYADMRATLETVVARGDRTVVVYPCSDQGYGELVRAIEEYRDHPRVSLHENIEAPDFWGLLARSQVLVGNSSAGLIETPYLGIPAINLGERQHGRQHAENVVHAEFGRESLAAALDLVTNDTGFRAMVANCSRPFGDGQAYRRIVDVLRSVPLDQSLLGKRMTY